MSMDVLPACISGSCMCAWCLWRREEGNRVIEVVSHHLGARIWIQVLWKGSSSFLMSNLYDLKGTFYVLHFNFNWENKIDDIQDRQKISVLSIYTMWRSKSRAGGTAHMGKVLAMQVQGPEFGALSLTLKQAGVVMHLQFPCWEVR